MGQAAKGLERLGDIATRETECPHGRKGGGGILPVVNPKQGLHTVKVNNLGGFLGGFVDQDAIAYIDAACDTALDRHRYGRTPAASAKLLMDPATDIIVNPDDRGLLRFAAREDPGLGCNVVREITVTLDVIGRNVEQNRDVTDQRANQIELEGRKLQHVDAVIFHRIEIEHGRADIAAQLDIQTGLLEQMRSQCRSC